MADPSCEGTDGLRDEDVEGLDDLKEAAEGIAKIRTAGLETAPAGRFPPPGRRALRQLEQGRRHEREPCQSRRVDARDPATTRSFKGISAPVNLRGNIEPLHLLGYKVPVGPCRGRSVLGSPPSPRRQFAAGAPFGTTRFRRSNRCTSSTAGRSRCLSQPHGPAYGVVLVRCSTASSSTSPAESLRPRRPELVTDEPFRADLRRWSAASPGRRAKWCPAPRRYLVV